MMGLIITHLMASLACAQETAAPAAEKKVRKTDPTSAFYESGVIPRLRIEIAKAEMEELRRTPRVYVRCTVTELVPDEPDRVYTEVGIHLKGAAGSFRNIDDRPGLTLSFDKFNKEQRFHGLSKFHLNNAVQDPTLLHEALAGTIFREAGIPAARCTHARVWLNGRDLNLYVLKEGFKASMFRGILNDRSGTIYEGHFVSDIDKTPTQKTNKSQPDVTRLQQLLEAVRQKEPAARREAIARVLDVDQFMTVMALEAMICHWDGYGFNRNNYRLYHDPGSDKLMFLPHGMDQVFGNLGMGLVPGSGMVCRAVLEHPDDRARYFERVGELRQHLDPEKLAARIEQMSARVVPVLEEINPGAARNHREQAKGLAGRVARRAVEIDRQLASIPRPLRFNESGMAAIDGWQPRIEGPATGDRFDDGGRQRLRIKTTGANMASFRATVLLPRGKYVFEGRGRAVGVNATANPGMGAGLRISGGQRPGAGLIGDSGWQDCAFEFEVTEAMREVVLVCEVRASAGEAHFELESLRLRRR
jgi:spore coat protein H